MPHMEHAAQLFAAVCFLVIGLSHLFQPLVWVAYFRHLAEKGSVGAFIDGFSYIWFGGMIVAFHNVWHGLPMILTLIGWIQVAKGLVRFVFPEIGLRVLRRVSPERAWEFRVAGVVALVVSAFLWYLRLRP